MMKIWKRLIATMLLLLICGSAMAIEETGQYIGFDTQFTDEMDKSTTEWFSTGFERATLTTCLAIDLKLELGDDFDFEKMLTSPTYVGESDDMLIVVGRNDNSLIVMNYRPITNQRKYMVLTLESSSESMISSFSEAFLLEICKGNYYKNDVEDIETNIKLFAKTVNE